MSLFLKAGDVVVYSRRQEDFKRGDLVRVDGSGRDERIGPVERARIEDG